MDTVKVEERPSIERAIEASKPHFWLREIFFHARGKDVPGCVPFTCIPPELAEAAKKEPGLLSDATVIYAHRWVLASRSEAFNFMLYTNTLSQVVIHCNPVVFEAFLQFVYTETLPKGIPTLYSMEELICVAESYQCYTVERQLAEIVRKTVRSENVIDIMEKAVRLNSTHLQRICAMYISENQNEVVQSASFRALRANRDPTEIQRTVVSIVSNAVFQSTYPLPPPLPHAVNYDPSELTDAEIDDVSNFTLVSDLCRACAANIGADVQLISKKDNLAVWCSKWLISVRSAQFVDRFVEEKISEDVKAKTGCSARASFDVSAETLQALVLYLYAGEVSAPTDVLIEMVPLAEKAGLDHLSVQLDHAPAATVTPKSAVAILVAMKKRGLPQNDVSTKRVTAMCYSKILSGWHVAANSLVNLLKTDLSLFLRTLSGSFSDEDDEHLDERISLMHWKSISEKNIVKRVLLDFVGSAGDLNLESTPLACKDTDQIKISLRVLDFADDLGASVLSERIADAILSMIETHQLFAFVRLTVDHERIGTGGGRDALLIKLLASIATLPSLDTILDHDQAMHLLRHVRVSDPFPGKRALEDRLISNTVSHASEIDTDIYGHLPFETQLQILTEKMEKDGIMEYSGDDVIAMSGVRENFRRLTYPASRFSYDEEEQKKQSKLIMDGPPGQFSGPPGSF